MTIEYKDSKRIVGLSTSGSGTTVTSASINDVSHFEGTVGANYVIGEQITGGTLVGKTITSLSFYLYQLSSGSGGTDTTFTFGIWNSSGVLQKEFGSVNRSSLPIGSAFGDAIKFTGTATDSGYELATDDVIGLRTNTNPASAWTVEIGMDTTNPYSDGQRALFVQGSSPAITSARDIPFEVVYDQDLKPTDVQDNSILIEKDTANRYWFDSGLAPTYEPSLTNLTSWLPTNNSSSNKITLNTGAGKVDIIATRDGNWNSLTYNLGSALSNTEWVVRARINITDLTAGNQAWFVMGMSKVPSSTDISGEGSGSTTDSCLGFIMYESTYKRFGLAGGNDRKAVVVDMGYDTLGFTPAEDTYYYVELKRTSDSGAIFTVRTGSHEGTVVQSKTNTGNLAGASDLQYLGFYMMKDNASGGAFVTEVDQITIHNAVTSVTPATWTMNPTWEDNFADFTVDTTVDNTEVKGWTPNDASEAWIDAGTNSLDFNQGNDSSNNAIVFDMQSSYGTGANISDTKWRLDFETIYDSFSGGQNQALHWFGFSSDDETVSRGTAQDGITIQFNPYASNWGISDADNTALPEDGTGMSLTYSTATTYYWSIWRDGDTVTATRWSDSTRSTASQTDTEDISTKTITGLRYIKWMNRTLTSIGTVVGRITNITMYNGAISPN